MQNNISSIKTEDCCGCGACYNKCPTGAISMQENNEGFLYPVIDEIKCTNCGLCKKVCPYYSNKLTQPECYAYLGNDESRLESSSGGVFPVVANYFIKNGGYVAGAVYDENISVKHIVSNNIKDIEKMRNSKYLQSDIGRCYSNVKDLLLNNKLVLFTGTPCQIAGLKSFLQKDYEKLYCIDIICHGVPSPKVFKKYINEKISSKDEKWLNTNFRDKMNGLWSRLTTTTTTTTTTDSAQNDVYMQAFLNNLCLRKTCSNCKFQSIPRQGDITIGDFWGIWNYDKNLNDEKGTSAVLVNNSRGQYLFDILKSSDGKLENVPLDIAISGNPCLVRSVHSNKDRKLFFDLLDKKNLKDVVESCLNDKVDYLIVNFWDSYFNYGALLTAYAMQELIKNYGYTCKLLDVGQRTNEQWYKNSFMENFAERFLDITNKLNFEQSAELSKNVKGVILGSDQILRVEYINYNIHKYLLNWVDKNTKKIAISPSFGINKDEYLSILKQGKKSKEFLQSALSSFNYLSCREKSGEKIYKDIFKLEADYILDPVFLIDKNKYNRIINSSKVDYSDKIVSYILDENENYNDLYKYLQDKENTEIINLSNSNCLTEDWLKNIKDCKLLLTDSFHGVCFALIFNKPFICIRNKDRGDARFQSLIDEFDIQKNFVYKIDEIYKEDFDYSINYNSLNNKLERKIKSDLNIINKVFNENYSNNPNADKNKIKNKKYVKHISNQNKLKIFKLKLNYYRCRFLANITFGKKRNHYIDKKNQLKLQLREEVFLW